MLPANRIRASYIGIYARQWDVDFLLAKRPVGLMDKASASGAGDSRFESWAGHFPHGHAFQARAKICGGQQGTAISGSGAAREHQGDLRPGSAQQKPNYRRRQANPMSPRRAK